MKKTRDEIQEQIIAYHTQGYKKITIEWVTGLGKTKGALGYINELKKTISGLSVLILTAEISHKENWIKEINKHYPELVEHFVIECYASVQKHEELYYHCIIFDECHHITERVENVLGNISFDNCLFLSATINSDTNAAIKRIKPSLKYVKHRMSFGEVFDNNLLPKPNVIIYNISLDNTRQNHVYTKKRGKLRRTDVEHEFNDIRQFKDRYFQELKTKEPYSIRLNCTSLVKYNLLLSDFDYAKKAYFNKQVDYLKNNFLRAGLLIKQFMGNYKSEYLSDIEAALKQYKTLFFAGDIEHAEKFSLESDIPCLHSKQGMKTQSKILGDFLMNNKSLIVINKLKEGINIPNLDCVVIAQLSKENISFVQQVGRALRSETPVVIVLQLNNTKDQDYIRESFSVLPCNISVVNNTQELTSLINTIKNKI